jgi:hypothetical protein
MHIPFEIDDNYGGVPQGHIYEMGESPEADKDWKDLRTGFSDSFSELKEGKDYEFTFMHYGTRALAVYLYSEKPYNCNFIDKVAAILRSSKEAYAKFECYDANQKLIGHFMVFKEKAIFSRDFAESGRIDKMFP